MRKLIYFIIALLFFANHKPLNAQCPVGTFTASDTVCPQQAMSINNNSSTAASFNWDFCLGDLDSLPAALALPSIGGTLSYPLNMKMVEENGLYYGFITNAFGGNYITRYDFGNSPTNTPTAVNLTADPLLGNATAGIDMVKEGSKWYMFLTCYSSNALLRYEMDSLTQLNPTLSNLNIAGLANPYSIKVIEGYAFITNNQTVEITRLDFGGSYANAPTVMLPAISTGATLNFGIDIAYDCETGKYIGYSTSAGFGIVFKLDFGNSLNNLPAITAALTTYYTAQGIQLIKEANEWHLFMVSENNNYYHFTSGSSLNNQMAQVHTSNFGGIMANPINIQLVKKGSDWTGIIPNKLLFSIVRLTFPQGCSGPVIASADQSPANISFPPAALGKTIFQLKETMPNGSTSYFLDSVYVLIPPPVADFSTGAVCKNTPVQFTDISSTCYGNIIGWKWDFGDGGTSTQQSPTHTYSSASGYTVNLTVYADNGDSATTQQSITIHDLPQAWFSRPDSACAGSDVIFSDSSTCNDGVLQTWNWTFGGNANGSGIQPIHAYLYPGTYQVQLTITSSFGCMDSVIRPLFIQPGPFSDFTVYNTCDGETAQFLNLTTSVGTTVSSSTWSFGDGNFSNTSNPSHLYAPNAADYSVELISVAANGCSDSLTKNIRIANRPSPWFTISDDTVCTFTSLQFSDSSFAGAGDTIVRRFWDFGDGTLDSISLAPTHFYTTPGSYTISLRILSPTDCDSTVTKSVFVIESPSADFTVSNVCFGQENSFIDNSSSPAGSFLTSWQWDFGDSTNSSSSNTQHTYAGTGVYTVHLIVSSSIGCYDTTSQQVTIFELPVAKFGNSKACTNTPIQFTDSSTVTGSFITGWQWDFGNSGAGSIVQNPVYDYPSAFAYLATLITTSAQGCSDTISKFIAVDQTPEFSISASDNCFGTSSTFTYQPVIGSSSNVNFIWNFGDSTASFLSNPSHLYNLTGDFNVLLSVTDLANACVGTQLDTVTIFPLPKAGFSASKACIGIPVQFSDSSSIAAGTITSWNWTFSTLGNSTLQSPSQSFSQTGTLPVRLIVNSDRGCTDSLTKTLLVNGLPHVSFQSNPPYGAPPLPVQFTNTSDQGVYLWNFGDNGSVSNATSPLYQYTDTGNYVATLVVTDTNGCIDSAKTTIYIQIPRRDLAIKGASFTKVNDKWEMKAIVSNLGNEDALSFELKANLNSEGQFYNTFDDDTLKVGQTRTYTFNTKLDAGIVSPAFFCTEVISINNEQDINESNNKFCISSSTGYQIINVYPNPFIQYLYAGINMTEKGSVDISITDLLGKTCLENTSFLLKEGLNTLEIPVTGLNSSIYFLRISYKENENYIKIFRN